MKKEYKIVVVFILIVAVSNFATYQFYNSYSEQWPEIKIDDNYQIIIEKEMKIYQENKYAATPDFFVDYNFEGEYLDYGKNNYTSSDKIAFDDKGIPKNKYGNEYQYNPVGVAQYALAQHAKYIRGGDEENLQALKDAIECLLSLQDDSGAFRYNFKWKYYLSGETYDEGWVSAMAQGQAISALTRAYLLTEDERYLTAGEKAFDFLVTPISEGGTLTTLADLDKSLDKYIFFEEYISSPNNYTLNGYMFTLLGVYDWWRLSEKLGLVKSKVYQDYFYKGIQSLVKLLPYYDIGGLSSYDLGHYTFEGKEPHVAARYHLVHIKLLHALYSVSKEKRIRFYERSWLTYVQ